MLKFHAALIFILTAGSLMAAPAPQESDSWELIAKLCGRLEYADRVADKVNPLHNTEKYRPVKDAKLMVYERHGNIPCCESPQVLAETTSNKSGAFEFKGLSSGNYWFAANVDQQRYLIPVVVKRTEYKLPACSEMTFAIEASGKFVLRVQAPGR